MPALQDPCEETITYFVERFGVERVALLEFSFVIGPDDVWASTAVPIEALQTVRPPGLRAARRMRGGLKPTSSFLRAIGSKLTASRVEIDDPRELTQLLLGHSVDTSLSEGYVALSYRGDVLGCGLVKGGRLRAVLPTGQRNELLKAIS